MTIEPGDQAFGRFRLLGLIGEGGMGKVYKAHDTVIDRDVALKVLPTELAQQPGYRERFRREARTAARLTEPHIIPIHDTGEIDGHLYLVMPVIDGVDVASLLKRDGPMTPQRAVAVIEQLAAALDAAHKNGLVHRDIKPSNALMTEQDFVYLIDFGIAHDAAATRLTSTGMMVGTMAYMAPERFNTGSADASSDVYSLACVLYECLTGATPFRGNSVEQQMAGHLTQAPPKPSSTSPDIATGFDEVIATGMAKNPNERYPSALELAAAARRAVSPIHTDPIPPATAPEPIRQQSTELNLAETPTRPAVSPHHQDATPPPTTHTLPRATPSKRKWLIAGLVVLLIAVGGGVVLARNVLSSNGTGAELVLTAATDPGVNPFMAPAASAPPTNTQAPPTLQPHGGGQVVTQPLPGDRDGLYGGTLNNAECDRDQMITFLSGHPAQASAFVDALNADPTLYWSGGHPLTAADIPTYLGELTPAVLRLDTRVTNHGFDGTHPTTLQSVFQPGTAVFVDAHGVPRARCFCGNPLTAPAVLTGEPKPVGTPWPGYNPEALAAVQPSTVSITKFVLVDVVTGQPFNRPAGTTGANDTPHDQPVAPPQPAPSTPTTGQDNQADIDGTYRLEFPNAGGNCHFSTGGLDVTASVTHQGNTLTLVMSGETFTGNLNADGSFVLNGPHQTYRGVFTGEGGSTIIRDGVHTATIENACSGPLMGTKQ